MLKTLKNGFSSEGDFNSHLPLTLEASLAVHGLPPDSDAEAASLPNTTNPMFAAST